MNIFEKWSNKLGKQFEKGKPLYPLHSFFDAVDTFFLTPKDVTTKGCHIRDAVDMKRIMITVIIALFPPLLFGLWNIGYQHFTSLGLEVSIWQSFLYGFLKWLPLVIVVYVSGLTVEIIFAQRRKHQVAEGFFVTGFLIPLILPPDIPLWIVAIATIFAVIFGKEVFGGTGYNFLNPALLARVFIFFAYPSVISGDNVWIAEKADAYSGATPLGNIMNDNLSQIPSILELCIGNIPGSIGET
ncbi:MAG TPA: RnfABCDGE type electron transport complex subunit D, partial [Bacteroidales bacterium]|nr:RnfABCDGE type electron transport complex subunit D [Bacteroidales bacterium]